MTGATRGARSRSVIVGNTIYIVHPANEEREALALMVESAVDEVLTFACPEEFLEAVTPNAGGCVIAPADVPGMGMSELIRAIRARGLALPVLALGGCVDVAAAVRVVRAGAADYVEPPVSARRLRRVIRRTLTLQN
jgi:FixJ family two-component response regulator